MRERDDIIQFFLAQLRELQPEIPEALHWRIEDKLRAELGGREHYVRKTAVAPAGTARRR